MSRLRSPFVLAAMGAVLAASILPASGQEADSFADLPAWDEYGFQGEGDARVQNVDRRTGTVQPTEAQLAAVERLGASNPRFNQFGTPHMLINYDGTLSAPREGAAADVARDFVRDNAALFRLDAARVDALVMLRDSPLYDAPDLDRVYRDKVEPANPDVAHSVMFRQSFGDLPAGLDGLLTVGVKPDGSVASVSSSVTGDAQATGEQRLDPAAAITAAALDVEMDLGTLTETPDADSRFLTYASDLVDDPQRARLVGLPTPENGVRRAYEVTLLDSSLDEHGNPTAFSSFVDAETGQVWKRDNRVEHFAQGAGAPQGAGASTIVGAAMQEEGDPGNSSVPLPQWNVFPANPPFAQFPTAADEEVPVTEDTRVLWCWDNETNPEECVEEQRNDAARQPWDVNPPSTPSFTTDGNYAQTAISDVSPFTPDTAVQRPTSLTRDYDFEWGNKWNEESCNPANFTTVGADTNDESAATTNLFVMHNRMHDWSYYLGFTENNFNMQKTNFGNTGPDRENDPEVGQAQGGRRTPIFGRDNANQITLNDGIAPITNQYLWQPLAGAFYSPCVDGAYDMAVVAHEYGHAITNRMIAGPDAGTGDSQGQTESWSDLVFAAYFSEFAISSGDGGNPLALGPYVTGDSESAIRNYSMNESPLQYGDLEYDGNGLTSPHANGEVWSATNFDISQALSVKYDEQFPSSDEALQRSCARGERASDECPGNRQWNQIQFDSFLLAPADATMVDSRDAMLAGDMLRFDGANQDELWDSFARRGLGQSAISKPILQGDLVSSPERDDFDPTPGYDSPLRGDEAQITFVAPEGVTNLEVFTGQYEARVTPVADTDADTPFAARTSFIPGEYEFIARADGFGGQRFSLTIGPEGDRTVEVPMRRNVASAASGAEISGDGFNLEQLIDDTEDSNWASRESEGTDSEGKGEGAQVEGRQVTVDLAGDEPVTVREVQVSAALNGGCSTTPLIGDCPEEEADTGSQNRFSALRSFDIFTCNAASGADCGSKDGFTQVFSSADDAFPSARPRPKVSDLHLRPFEVTESEATHLRLVVRDNQCTGAPDFQGETNPDDDPNFNPDCDTEFEGEVPTADREVLSPPFDQVRAAELQVFSTAVNSAPGAPVLLEEAPTGPVTPEARTITNACPPDEVPANSRPGDSTGNFFEPEIDCMIWYEIAEGTSDTLYEPKEPVGRGQMASFIARLIEESGGQLDGGDVNAFTDDDGSTHEESINKLAANGIIDGKEDGGYDHLGTVTRDQMAKFLVQGYEFRSENAITPSGDYFDDDTDNTHEENINKSAEAGFTNGRDGGYQPKSVVLRDAMAGFLARVLDLLVEEGTTVAKSDRA